MVIAGDLPGIVAVHFDDLREIIIYGIKAVWKEGQAVYAMNYMGRVLEDGFSGNFLKEALRAADVKMPSIILQVEMPPFMNLHKVLYAVMCNPAKS